MKAWQEVKIRLESWYWQAYWLFHDDPEDSEEWEMQPISDEPECIFPPSK